MDLQNIIITDVTNVWTVFSPKGRLDKMYKRTHYGLSFTNEGQITYTHKGKSFISDHSNAIILPKGQSYTIYGNKSGKFPVINFECKNFNPDTFTILPVKNINSVIEDFERMKALFLSGGNKLTVMSIFYKILESLIKSESAEEDGPLTPALKYLESNYSYDITNKTLALKCNISEVYFRKLFTKTYGISPKQYIINMRINKAKQILSEGILKINAVSEQCGFSNPYHFCRLFKKKTGVTPSEYMNKNRNYKI